MKSYAILLLIVFIFQSCQNYPDDVNATLKLAGNNRKELEKVLTYYKSSETDSLKYKAACHLINHMKWHKSTQYCNIDSLYFKINKKLELIYNIHISQVPDQDLFNSKIYTQIISASVYTGILIENTFLDSLQVNHLIRYDPQFISSDFLIKHIDNAFYVWENSSFAKFLTFEEFKEYILPYRSVVGYPYYNNGNELYNIFNKKLLASTKKTYQGYMERFQHYVNSMRYLWAYKKKKPQVGLFDLF